MRGSLTGTILSEVVPGIIPAHAGLTRRCRSRDHVPGDHPRACGAHFGGYIKLFTVLGSSPRMRGSPHEHQRDVLYEGIIPAHAGLTAHAARRKLCPRDHPRACGAHWALRRLTG